MLAGLLGMFILFSLFTSLDLFKNRGEGFVEGNRSRRRRNRPRRDNVKRNVEVRNEKAFNYKFGDQVPAVIPETDDITSQAPTNALARLTENAMSNQALIDQLHNN